MIVSTGAIIEYGSLIMIPTEFSKSEVIKRPY